MINKSRPISMAEVMNLVKDSEKGEEVKKFIKNFDVLGYDKAMELTDELRALDLIKLKDEHIVKVVDFIPTDAAELNKVLIDLSLDTDEVNKILDVTKKFK